MDNENYGYSIHEKLNIQKMNLRKQFYHYLNQSKMSNEPTTLTKLEKIFIILHTIEHDTDMITTEIGKINPDYDQAKHWQDGIKAATQMIRNLLKQY